jgi:biotin carboxylase
VACHFLLIGTARDIHPKIRQLGHRLSLICPLRNLKTLSNHDIYDRVIGMPMSATPEEWVEQARLIERVDPVDVLGGFNEVTQHLSAIIGAALGLPYHAPQVIQRTRQKDEMRRVLREAGVDATPARLVEGGQDDIVAFGEAHGYPLVLKPVDGRGSLGISIVRSAQDVPTALAWFGQWASQHAMLVEKLLSGEEYSVEAFSEHRRHRVVCVTQKFKDPRTSVEIGHCLPAPLPQAAREMIERFVCDVLTAIGLEDGPSHTEVFATADGPRIVETHARLAGDNLVDLIQLTSGVDLDELWIRQVAGESVLDEVPTQLSRWASIAYASPQAEGTLERVDGEEQASTGAGVVRVGLLQEPGTQVHGAHDSFSRGAYAIAVGDSSDEAVARARAAVSKFRFVVVCSG